MQLVRPAIAMDPRYFGRGRFWDLSVSPETRAAISDDVKLFATTFVAGFLFVSILIS
jgi:hypothetical protein